MSAPFVRTRCRCRHCNRRRTLPRHPYLYEREPACPACGARSWAVDTYRQSGQEAAATTCRCDGFPYPHRRGSSSGAFLCTAASAAAAFHAELLAAGLILAGSSSTSPAGSSAEPPF